MPHEDAGAAPVKKEKSSAWSVFESEPSNAEISSMNGRSKPRRKPTGQI